MDGLGKVSWALVLALALALALAFCVFIYLLRILLYLLAFLRFWPLLGGSEAPLAGSGCLRVTLCVF